MVIWFGNIIMRQHNHPSAVVDCKALASIAEVAAADYKPRS